MDTSGFTDLGQFESYQIKDQTVLIRCSQAHIGITVYTAHCIKVQIAKVNQELEFFSYAVIAQPQTEPVQLIENQELIQIETSAMFVRFNKISLQIGFYTICGQQINEDELGLPTSWTENKVTAYKKMQEGERFIGLGEKVGPQDKRGMAFTNWNTDVFGYRTDQDPLYTTFPFYIGIHHQLNYGIFLDNTYQTEFNFGASNHRFASFAANGGQLSYYFIYDQQVSQIINHYSYLTGYMPLPPKWSLGYQQNRYSYYPDKEVINIAHQLRRHKIPADGITLDIHYMDGYKLFTWDNIRFPEPLSLVQELKDLGFKTTIIVDPGIKVAQDYPAYEDGIIHNVFVKYPDQTPYQGQVWPGWCHFPDFTNPKVRNWWAKQMETVLDKGIDGVWNDMNEIATWGNKMPDNLFFDYDGHPCLHLKAHNVYGFNMVRASYNAFIAYQANKRPFVLTRAAYAGIQRYGAVWTGDNRAEDSHMLLGVRMLLSLGICGVAFTGMDIGGFTGGASCSLYIRWVQLGSFTPYMRNHAQINTKAAEPWTFGEEALEICRNYINLRYRLLPYIYSAFYTAHTQGQPLMQSLAIHFTHDQHIYDPQFDNQYLFGHALLVAPVISTTQFSEIYFPQGLWYNLYTDQQIIGSTSSIISLKIEQLPVFVRESSIIPMQSLVQHTAEKPSSILDIHLYRGDHENTYIYYEDDGDSFDYRHNNYYKRSIRYSLNQLDLSEVEGSFVSHFTSVRLLLHGFQIHHLLYQQNVYKLSAMSYQFIDGISNFDPQGQAKAAPQCLVLAVELPLSQDAMCIQFITEDN